MNTRDSTDEKHFFAAKWQNFGFNPFSFWNLFHLFKSIQIRFDYYYWKSGKSIIRDKKLKGEWPKGKVQKGKWLEAKLFGTEKWRQRKCDHRQSGFSSRRKKKSSWHIALFCSSGVKIALLSVQLGNFDSFFGVARLESAGKVCMSHFVWFSPQSVVNRCPKLLSN